MKSRNQTGSAHVVIIIILVVALLSALGFVFWQNFVQKPQVAETTNTAKTKTETAEPATTETSLVVGDYRVEVPYDSVTDTYTLTPRSAGGYTVYSKKVTVACGSQVNIGVINRYDKGGDIPTPNNLVTIGAYDYTLLIGGYGNCTDTDTTVLEDVTTAFGKAFDNLRATN